MQLLGNKQPAECMIDGGASMVVQAGKAPIVNGVEEHRMRVGCGSAAVGIFARQLFGHADEVVVVDDHITGVLTEHQAGRCLDMPPLRASRCAGANRRPGAISRSRIPAMAGAAPTSTIRCPSSKAGKRAWRGPGLRLLMTSTTGEHCAVVCARRCAACPSAEMPAEVRRIVERIGENCEPSLCTVLFLGGAGGSLRAGVTENPVLLTRAIKRALVNVTCGGAPAYVWPGGGITVMADVLRMPDNSFGTVPTPAIVAPIEFSMRREDYRRARRSHGHVFTLERGARTSAPGSEDGAPLARRGCVWTQPIPGLWAAAHARLAMSAQRSPLDGGRWHLNHGPIDIVAEAHGDPVEVAVAHELAWRRFGTVLDELVAELPLAAAARRGRLHACAARRIARRMWQACAPFREGFITPMAAVAGAVAQELIGCYHRPGIERAWINNGGDIALHLRRGPFRARRAVRRSCPFRLRDAASTTDGQFDVAADMPVRGVATSGWRGRSFSLGIADSVTVLAATAAEADAAATVIANAVDVEDPGIHRKPASACKDDSDLGDIPVTTNVETLPPAQVARALDAGAARAEALRRMGLVSSALLVCQGQWRLVQPLSSQAALFPPQVGGGIANDASWFSICLTKSRTSFHDRYTSCLHPGRAHSPRVRTARRNAAGAWRDRRGADQSFCGPLRATTSCR